MTTLVIGGTGFISSTLVRHLLGRGHRVTLLTRGVTQVPPDIAGKAALVAADRSDHQALRRVVGQTTFDVAYDMIAYLPEESAAAARAFRGRVGRFIHCSTVSVYMVSREVQCPVTEDQDCGPLMDYFPRNPFGMEYGIKKRQCETVLWNLHDDRAFPVSMLRPTYVSGPADPARRDWFWIQRILDGGPLLVPGSGDLAFQQVYLEDVARAFAMLPESDATVGRAYNIVGEEVFSLNEYLQLLGEMLNRRPDLVHVGQEEFDALEFSICPEGDVFTFNPRRTAVFSLDRIRHDLGYRGTPFQDYMRTTIDWWTVPDRVDSYGYARRKDEIAYAHRIRHI